MAEDHQRYRIDERLHHGLVESWSGLDRTLDRPVTIRILDPSSEVGKRVQLQARSLVRLEHPSLLHVLDTIELDDRVGLVTETLPETSLEEHLALEGILSPEETLAVATQLGEALLSLHSAGFAIGDLQAKHIGRRKDGTVVIVDGPPTSDANTIPARPQDDIVSLGELIHELLVGFRPQLDHQGRHEIHPAISSSFRQLIRRSVDRDNQWSDASALVLALRSLNQDLDRVSSVVEPGQIDYLKAERSWLAPAAFVGILAAVVILVGLLVTRTQVGSSLVENVREVVRLEAEEPIVIDNFENSTSVTTTVVARPESISSKLLIVSIVPFDPEGDGRRLEHPEKVELINNGDSSSGWYTERYTTADFGKLKDGVGLIISLGPPQQIDRLRISSPTIDWSFEIFASEKTGGGIQEWGDPVAIRDEISGTITVDLEGVPGATLLLWITSLGRELPAGGHRVTVSEISVTGRPKYG
ncbi:MAG: hypothetical protein VX963_02655 [Actinomycetota bacterium]|jgi:hypothetical protein|nr:hypothetical protein [Acidimicrobiaceae bacterium]MEC7915163.1 hypothetical protein [Actinomycetota bacterium]MEC9058629.1 hypothetical protein [Actinomycetota bacterium]MEC9473898.1 hypothetical protein [Actinomycetota bacterium]